MRFVIAIFVGLFVTACSEHPMSAERTDNPNYVVETLFTHDGDVLFIDSATAVIVILLNVVRL